MSEIIAITNQKGGIGKTTTSVNLAQSLKKLGHSVLLIDTDPQANATDTYRAKIEKTNTLYDLFTGQCDARSSIQKTELGDIIAGDTLLYEADQQFTKMGKEYILKEAVKPITGQYEYIIIDTPPSLGVLLINTLTLANKVIIPITADRYALNGLEKFFSTLEDVRKYTNPQLEIAGLLIVKYDERTNIAKDLRLNLPAFAQKYNANIFDAIIRFSVAISYSQAQKTSIHEYDENSAVAKDYALFAQELLERTKSNG